MRDVWKTRAALAALAVIMTLWAIGFVGSIAIILIDDGTGDVTPDHGAELHTSEWVQPDHVRYRCADNGRGVIVEVKMPDREVKK